MRFFYSLSVRLYSFAIRLAAISGNRKAGLWIGGRKAQKQIFRTKHTEDKWLWFHVSSLGEFEQGRPLIEYYKSNHAGYKILLTFFSPSGFEIRKNYKEADLVLYLPADTICMPQIGKNFNVKAAFLSNTISGSTICINLKSQYPFISDIGYFQAEAAFFKWYGKWQCRQLRAFTHFFVQNENSATLLKKPDSAMLQYQAIRVLTVWLK